SASAAVPSISGVSWFTPASEFWENSDGRRHRHHPRTPAPMPFCTRVFCRDTTPPSLSEALFWLRQREIPVTITGGSSQHDLLSSFWEEVELSYDPEE